MTLSGSQRPAGPRRRAWGRIALRAAGSLAAAGLLAFLFRRADLGRIRALLAAAPWLLATPVFYFGVVCCDALGWRRLVMGPGRPPPWRRLLEARVAAEGLGLSLPSGGVLAEGVAIVLVRKLCGVPAGLAVASLAARRFFIFLSFGIALAASAVAGHPLLARISQRVIGRGGLEWVVPAAAAGVLLAAFGLRAALLGGELAGRMFRGLRALPVPALARWLEGRAEAFSEVDSQVETALIGRRSGKVVTTLCFMGIWACEVGETWFILTLLGAGLSLRAVFSFEGVLTLARGLAFFTPSGLGVQDLGYLAFIKGLGVKQAINVWGAFVVVKRGKEIFWIIIGYLLLARHAWRPSAGAGDLPGSAGDA
ncbi:MAG TPA: lysylphosphatidylglycerol synthase domain-containing protein [Thermoanaerobaculia bacterium]|nr:lysylphosphatidylglycerol synthase domain-containing protein [Thermoanaerobaculia bacterium]